MWFRALSHFLKRHPGKRGRRASRQPAAPRLQLEALEDRTLPSFYAPISYAAGITPMAVVTADFNRDDVLDLAVANYSSNSVSVLLGNGDGSFQTAANYATGANPLSLGAGDLDGDGKLDLATANETGGDVTVLLGNGDGTFGAPGSVPIPAPSAPVDPPLSVAVGDLNKDGKMDLVVTSQSTQTGGSGGYWGLYGWYPGSYYSVTNGYVHVLLGTGGGNFAAPNTTQLSSGAPVGLAVADLDGDGWLDVATANEDTSTVSVLLNNRSGALGSPANYNTGWSPRSVTVGDFTGDGSPDLATAGSTVDILPGLGNGTFQGVVQANVDPASLAPADFNGDGKLDLVTTEPYSGAVSVLLGNGDGTLRLPVDFTAGSAPTAVVAGDFNRDGRPDVAAAGGNTVSVLLNTGDWRTFLFSGFPSPTTAGEAQTLTVTAVDDRGNPLSNYTGTVHITSSDAQADLPADYTFTAADNGTHTFTVTLKSAGTQSVTVTDTGPTTFSGTQQGIVVNPDSAVTLQVSGFPSIATGDYGYVRVSAADAYGNAATHYAGTIHFTSSDGQAVLPGDYTFSEWDYGTAYFSASLATVGTQSLTVTDTVTPGFTATQSGIRVLPRATLSGPSAGLRNQTVTFTLGAVSGLPAGTMFTYAIDWDGDGLADQTVSGPSGTTVTHSYAAGGWYQVGVTATAHIGAEDYTSDTAYQSVTIFAVTATVQADPGDATRIALVVEGSAGADYLTLSPGPGNAIALSVSGYSFGSFAAPGGAAFAHLLVYGSGGDDTIRLTGGLAVPALLFGGDGNDTLYALDAGGSTANNVLVGGAGNDSITGGSGRDLLIGGLGADALGGAGGDDILIGGTTNYDANVQALLAIMKEWGRTDADYSTRVKHLQGSLGGGLNGSYFLTAATVHDDSNAVDNLYGNAGLDWFFAGGRGKKLDKVNDRGSEEATTTL